MTVRWKRIAWILATTPITLLAIDQLFFRGSGFPAPHMRIPRLFEAQRSPIPGTIALVVNGAISPQKNHARYWNNTSLVFSTLKSGGFERIVVLQSDGKSSLPDRQTRSFLGMFGTGTLLDGPRDLDGDGVEDVVGPGTLEALESELRELGGGMREWSRLLVFLTDHGQLRWGAGGLTGVAMMWQGGELRGSELDRMLRAYVPDSCWVGIVAAQCHSNLFLDEVKRRNTLLIASGRPLWIWSSQDYSFFPYHLCAALLGRDPASGEMLPEGAAATLREAFHAACKRDHAPEWPLLRVNGDERLIPKPF